MRILLELLRDERGAALVDYAIVASAVALPMLAIGVAVATTCGNTLTTTTTGMASFGQTPP